MLKPVFAILDETDSGLDIDAVRIVSEGVNKIAAKMSTGVLVITHYQRILNYIKTQFVHILFGGRIVENGGTELCRCPREEGYDWVRAKYPEAALDEDELKQQTPAGSTDVLTPDLPPAQGEGIPAMATDLGSQVSGIKEDYKYGFRDSDEHYSFKSRKGLDREIVQDNLRDEGRAELDARAAPEGARRVLVEADPDLGAATWAR